MFLLLALLHVDEQRVLHLDLLAAQHLDFLAHVVGITGAEPTGVEPILLRLELGRRDVQLAAGLVERQSGLPQRRLSHANLGLQVLFAGMGGAVLGERRQ